MIITYVIETFSKYISLTLPYQIRREGVEWEKVIFLFLEHFATHFQPQ